jgi:hypothetical protein
MMNSVVEESVFTRAVTCQVKHRKYAVMLSMENSLVEAQTT